MDFLNNDLLTHIHKRTSAYGLTDKSPVDDLKNLREVGYLSAFVPEEYGGAGLGLEEIVTEQAHLAKAAPGTALGISIHQIVVGLGRHLLHNGDPRGEIILRDVVAGELYDLDIPKPGNDLIFFGSITEALPSSGGGYSFGGVKIFTSLAPVWTCLITFGRDDSEGDGPRSVFVILKRKDGGFSIKDDWNTLDVRATQLNATILESTYAPGGHILTRCEPGPPRDPVVFDIFSHFEILLAATYVGIGERAIEVAAEHVKICRSVKSQSVYTNDPDIRWRVAEATIIMNTVGPQIHELARDIERGVDRGPIWMSQLSAVKSTATEASPRAVEQLIRACGGSAYYNGHGLSRLYRDVLAGLFQPNDQESLHGAWAEVVLGPATE